MVCAAENATAHLRGVAERLGLPLRQFVALMGVHKAKTHSSNTRLYALSTRLCMDPIIHHCFDGNSSPLWRPFHADPDALDPTKIYNTKSHIEKYFLGCTRLAAGGAMCSRPTSTSSTPLGPSSLTTPTSSARLSAPSFRSSWLCGGEADHRVSCMLLLHATISMSFVCISPCC